ncbi:MAG: type II toxin-antitoxin system HipA family toxin [Pusillimonas sp.]
MRLSVTELQAACYELEVFIHQQPVGLISWTKAGFVFQYYPRVAQSDFVSLLMPVRSQPYPAPQSGKLLPVFDMNLPEGSLRRRLETRFSKVVSGFNELALLALVGRNTLGRLSFGAARQGLSPVMSLGEMVDGQDEDELLAQLYAGEALFSGVAGVQPKALVSVNPQDIEKLSDAQAPGQDLKSTFRTDRVIIKTGTTQTPWLAVNEFYCMLAARYSGLSVPASRLLKGGQILLIERFDLFDRADGLVDFYTGAEDFCALSAKVAEQKYEGTYERVAKVITQFVDVSAQHQDLRQLFHSLTLSCVLRNGDAHLKNFTLLYRPSHETADIFARLSPAYDICTTNVYLPADQMALTLNGSKRYPSARQLAEFGQRHCGLSMQEIRDVFAQVESGLRRAQRDLELYGEQHPGFAEGVGVGMQRLWQAGCEACLTLDGLH